MIRVTKVKDGFPKLALETPTRPDLGLLITSDNKLVFRVSGFTQTDKETGVNRQEYYKELYKLSEPDTDLDIVDQNIACLVCEPDNIYDDSAIGVRLSLPKHRDLEGKHIGYVPKAINHQLLDYYSNFGAPQVAQRNFLKLPVHLHACWNKLSNGSLKTIYSIQVAISLDLEELFKPEPRQYSRFNYIDD